MPIQCAFYSIIQCETCRDMHFVKKEVCQNIARIISNIYIYYDRHLCKILLHLHQSLYAGVHFLQCLNYLACKCLKMLQLILSQVFQIGIISLEDNYLQSLLQTLGTTSDATKKDTFGTTLAWQIIIKTSVSQCFSYFVIYFRYCINLTNIGENF